ncbi:hypothetical protein FRACYDRAFT_271819 [Fragilariopsis cylindrus CCMP1102]|uniref:DUF6824 domain-containing protein n=1 Tax=Fragilariopsis cylindrus CCMP1102 TaxID=635003 RepID=A0A1E7EQD5_9STRA|nr:hypothetical protein FRACYDRAFT_271819 [Fragilariopsis cylindrus CCMP1102]|eukprot:OEU08006.1 hypothetical protein FRACYDRAFT_271819 [Fragilariopsis cylindrus CCMP1102]
MISNKEINPNDVLCGRGGLTNSHMGNQSFRGVVAEYQLVYLTARKSEKKGIAQKIVARIKENGGQFLQRSANNSDAWSISSDKRAVEKTSQALREGLDVKHKTVRPRNKWIRKRDITTREQGSSTNNQDNLVQGIVIDSPKVNEIHQEDLPDLAPESSTIHSFEPIFAFSPHTRMAPPGTISENDECDTVLSV